jgi:hypothetical protein
LFNEVTEEGANITNLVTISAAHDVKLSVEAHYGWLDPWNLDEGYVKKKYCAIMSNKGW